MIKNRTLHIKVTLFKNIENRLKIFQSLFGEIFENKKPKIYPKNQFSIDSSTARALELPKQLSHSSAYLAV